MPDANWVSAHELSAEMMKIENIVQGTSVVSKLTFSSITTELTGSYICIAQNQYGIETYEIKINVKSSFNTEFVCGILKFMSSFFFS